MKNKRCQSISQKKRKYRQIKRETKLNCARRVEAAAMHSYDADESMVIEGATNIPEVDATNWIGSLSSIPLAFIPTTFTGMYRRCIWAVGQSFEKAKDIVFPSIKIHKELESTQLKLLRLEQSLERILQEKETKTDANCCCGKSHFDSTSDSDNSSTSLKRTASVPLTVPPPPPGAPPPPVGAPPPPPPPPPPIKQVKEFKLVLNKVKKRRVENTKNDKETFHISANDLCKVKLRKVNRNESEKKTPDSGRGNRMGRPLVSLNDLQKVKLRRFSLGSNVSPKTQVVLRKRLPHEAVAFRTSLKKVSIPRSPGGTPLRRRCVDENGTGLTPLMTRALKRKFKEARSPSPLPMNSFRSPSSPVKPLRF
ncbi:uncharacterized protein [Antedon mediterranea]|uniref:uncharacterized protein n=1 Tax=Antedon mediterranea TaxID=105859 RepID=UPI003AF5DA7E